MNWEAIANELPTPEADAYHVEYLGATVRPVAWQNLANVPDPMDCWSIWCAITDHRLHPSQYSFESLVVALAPRLKSVAISFVEEMGLERRYDTGGEDYFQGAICEAVVDSLRKRGLPDFHPPYDEVETGPERLAEGPYVESQLIELQAPCADDVEQFGSYFAGAAYKAIVDLVNEKSPELLAYFGDDWITKVNGKSPWGNRPFDVAAYDEADELVSSVTPEEIIDGQKEWEDTYAAIEAACTGKNDLSILELSRKGNTEDQIGERLGLSRHQVHRVLVRVVNRAAKSLGLDLSRIDRLKKGARATGPDDHDETVVVNMKHAGFAESKIGEKLGLSQEVVAEALKDHRPNRDGPRGVEKNGTQFPEWWVEAFGSDDLKRRLADKLRAEGQT
jgi:hypothetical protein